MSVLFPGESDSLHVRLFSVGYIELGEWWTHADHLRTMWRLCRADDGGASLIYDSKRLPLTAGRFVLVPPGLAFEARLERPVKRLHIHFEVLGWTAAMVRELFAEPVVLPRDEFRERLADVVRDELGSSDHLDSALSCRAKSLVHLTLAELEKVLPDEDAAILRRVVDGQEELLSVLRFIDRHLEEPLSNTRLAEVAHASESCFIRRFREVIGQTPGRYVQERRVTEASKLLVSTNRSIEEVAERCGFANRYYFSRVFTQHMGRPPARYRNERPFANATETTSH